MKLRTLTSAGGIFIACLLLSLNPATFAQQATELPVHPGETLRYEIEFRGPDATKVQTVLLYLGRTPGGQAPNQPNFKVGFNGNQTSAIKPGVFRPEIVIPTDAMDGDYTLYVNAYFTAGSTQYQAGKQFQLHLIHITNPIKITPPEITVKPLP